MLLRCLTCGSHFCVTHFLDTIKAMEDFVTRALFDDYHLFWFLIASLFIVMAWSSGTPPRPPREKKKK